MASTTTARTDNSGVDERARVIVTLEKGQWKLLGLKPGCRRSRRIRQTPRRPRGRARKETLP